jgi:hypothetical protein
MVNVGHVILAANHALELLRLIVMIVQMDFSKKIKKKKKKNIFKYKIEMTNIITIKKIQNFC